MGTITNTPILDCPVCNGRCKLAPKQAIFVMEYPVDLNGTQAVIRAGYSKKGADVTAARLLGNAKVAEHLEYIVSKRERETGIDARYILNRLAEIDQMDALDIVDEDENLKPIREWPKIWRQMISGFDVKELYSKDKDGKDILIGFIKKIKWVDKIKNLELLGRHVSIGAWRDRIGLEMENSDDELIKELVHILSKGDLPEDVVSMLRSALANEQG